MEKLKNTQTATFCRWAFAHLTQMFQESYASHFKTFKRLLILNTVQPSRSNLVTDPQAFRVLAFTSNDLNLISLKWLPCLKLHSLLYALAGRVENMSMGQAFAFSSFTHTKISGTGSCIKFISPQTTVPTPGTERLATTSAQAFSAE